MAFELFVPVVVVTLYSRLFDGSIHAFHLAIGPWVLDLCEAEFDVVFPAAHVEHVGHEWCCWAICISRRKRELDTGVGENDVNFVGNGFDEASRNAEAEVLPVLFTSWTKTNLLVRSTATQR
jgi:hypothetical protein